MNDEISHDRHADSMERIRLYLPKSTKKKIDRKRKKMSMSEYIRGLINSDLGITDDIKMGRPKKTKGEKS